MKSRTENIFKKIILIALSVTLILAGPGATAADAASSYSKTLTTTAEIHSAFPQSYWASLDALKKAHPNWNFVAFNTGLSWNDLFDEGDGECAPARNLVDSNSIKTTSWYSTTISGSFNWASNSWTGYDTGNWYQASYEAIAYCMDPRNFLTEEQIFQFMDSASSIDSTGTVDAIESMLAATTGASFWTQSGETAGLYDYTYEVENPDYADYVELNGVPITYGDVNEDGEWDIFDAAVILSSILGKRSLTVREKEAADINGDSEADIFDAAILLSYIIGKRSDIPQRGLSAEAPSKTLTKKHYLTYAEAINQICEELDLNQITVASRIIQEHASATSPLLSGTYAFTLADGTTINGGYYNYFDIEAGGSTASAVYTNGLREAYKEGWDTRYKSLYGGAQKYLSSYISRGQTTLYSQKFNVDSSSNRCLWGQYMQNVTAPISEASRLYQGIVTAGALDSALTFIIPVFSNMPSTACAKPTKTGNPNYKMSYIWILDQAVVDAHKNDSDTSFLSTSNLVKNFNTDTLTYNITVPYETEIVRFYTSAYAWSTSTIVIHNDYADDPGPTDTLSKTTAAHENYYSLGVRTNTITVTCTAENGDSRTYTFYITREAEK